jgi:CBS domain containing-hemolysin-like protein
MNLLLAFVFLALALIGIVLRKTYYYLPLHELKRQAEKRDPIAVKLYPAAAYGNSLRGLLWLYIGLTSAASIIAFARVLPFWASLLIVGPLLWIAFSLIPATRCTILGVKVTTTLTPFIAWLLNFIHPLINRSADAIERRYVLPAHTRLFERDDLVELIERQQRQADNRLSDEELEIIKRALQFEDRKVRDILTPRKKVKTILGSDTIGPVLIDDLHKSGQAYALVSDKPKGELIGVLAFSRLSLHSTGQVKDHMQPTVYYLHENDSLSDALHAFFTTNHPVFAVLNSFEEYLGILTIEDVLKELLGHIPGDDFDQYADPKAVAARHFKPESGSKHKESDGENEVSS